ncbi:hypothetical protein ScPMuIL_012562 [Solemya velum]
MNQQTGSHKSPLTHTLTQEKQATSPRQLTHSRRQTSRKFPPTHTDRPAASPRQLTHSREQTGDKSPQNQTLTRTVQLQVSANSHTHADKATANRRHLSQTHVDRPFASLRQLSHTRTNKPAASLRQLIHSNELTVQPICTSTRKPWGLSAFHIHGYGGRCTSNTTAENNARDLALPVTTAYTFSPETTTTISHHANKTTTSPATGGSPRETTSSPPETTTATTSPTKSTPTATSRPPRPTHTTTSSPSETRTTIPSPKTTVTTTSRPPETTTARTTIPPSKTTTAPTKSTETTTATTSFPSKTTSEKTRPPTETTMMTFSPTTSPPKETTTTTPLPETTTATTTSPSPTTTMATTSPPPETTTTMTMSPSTRTTTTMTMSPSTRTTTTTTTPLPETTTVTTTSPSLKTTTATTNPRPETTTPTGTRPLPKTTMATTSSPPETTTTMTMPPPPRTTTATTTPRSETTTPTRMSSSPKTTMARTDPPRETTTMNSFQETLEAVSGNEDNLPVIIGCCVGLVLAIVGVSFYCRRRKKPPSEHWDNIGLVDVGIITIRRKRPVRIRGFERRVISMHKDSNFFFAEEFQELSKISPTYSCTDAERHYNIPKNRFYDILPFDHTRVKLQTSEDEGCMDYINASYIPGARLQREYIAAQGPLAGTIDDFWRMVWEHNSTVIVMLTKCKEGYQIKCEKYWPEEIEEPKQYGDIVVTTTSVSAMGKYNISVFCLRLGEEIRTVKHFQFLRWPDYTASLRHSAMIDFVETIRSHMTPGMEGPLIVHCSAGIGRTGTYIAVDTLMQKLKTCDPMSTVDVFDTVLKARENRHKMVLNEQQYIFIYDCLLEAITRQFDSQDLEEVQDTDRLEMNADSFVRPTRTSSGTELLNNSCTNLFEDDINTDPNVPLRPTLSVDTQLQGISNPRCDMERTIENFPEDVVSTPDTSGKLNH